MTHDELRAQAIAELEPQIAEMVAVKKEAIKGAAAQRVTDLETQLEAARQEVAMFEAESAQGEVVEGTEPVQG